MLVDYEGKAVLVTGGTKGIGLATALAFAKRGADVTITHKWGSVSADAIVAGFRDAGATAPTIVDADATNIDDVRAVVERIRATHGKPFAIVSNVAIAPAVHSLDEYVQRNLHRTIDAMAWTLVSHVLATREICKDLPRYVVGVSSAGTNAYHVNYDFAAAGKAVLEVFVRYLSHRLMKEGVRINAVQTRFVDTESLRTLMSDAFPAFVAERAPDLLTPARDVAEAIFGLCSGLMDGMAGQILNVDRGAGFADGFSRFYRDDVARRTRGTTSARAVSMPPPPSLVTPLPVVPAVTKAPEHTRATGDAGEASVAGARHTCRATGDAGEASVAGARHN